MSARNELKEETRTRITAEKSHVNQPFFLAIHDTGRRLMQLCNALGHLALRIGTTTHYHSVELVDSFSVITQKIDTFLLDASKPGVLD